ncbi:MAG: AtpZ/AtpI family protein [Pseudomonadota bacterium]|nr:AtpZ/AtpI family protein [Pseudomonadota bacterium]MEE3098160.1 AtpZ/AtpI family protein [Pseudomonadota bacterium]
MTGTSDDDAAVSRDPDRSDLSDIDARLQAIRSRREAETRISRAGGGKWQGAEFAWRMVIDLTAGVAVGAGMGWGLDSLFGTKPLFLLAFVLLGFGAGVRVMLQSAKDLQRRNKAGAPQGGAGSDGKDGARAPEDEGR